VTPVWLYVVTFVAALVVSLVLVPVVRNVAHSRDIVDKPGGHKSHHSPVPYLGGVAMFGAFSVAAIIGAYVLNYVTLDELGLRIEWLGFVNDSSSTFRELLVILGLGLLLSAMGLIDDLRGLSPLLRFLVEVAVAVVVVANGIHVVTPMPDWVDMAISVVWIVGITNSFNLLDNIDGLAAGTASVASISFFLIAIINDQKFSALLAIGLAGCMLGFLRSNFHPATIYMGDAGSLFIGFFMAYLGLKMRTAVTEIPQYFVPIVVLGVAVLDTAMVFISRIKRGVSPFLGGQDHLSHRFVRLGFSVRRSVNVLLVGGAALGLLAVALSESPAGVGWWILAATGLAGIAATITLTTKRAMLSVVGSGSAPSVDRQDAPTTTRLGSSRHD
jgi:UDP-GlcNAc:undecaprenyl-phosphate GlcNAc-1-phosphate transferase